MKRLQAAAIILAALCLLTWISQHLVSGSLDALETEIVQVEALCTCGEYRQAQEQLREMAGEYRKQQAVLALFIRRDQLNELDSALNGLSAYAQPDYLQDLLCETGMLKARLNGVRRLFFGLL